VAGIKAAGAGYDLTARRASKKGSDTFVRSTLRAVPATVSDPFLNPARESLVREDERPLCSVVIPTYNGRALLETCLASVALHRPTDPRLPIEVIVADDASTDGTGEWLACVHPDVCVVRLERNGGFCAAANAGIALARGRFIQVLNNDTEVAAGWIEAGLEPFTDPTVGAVAPLVLVRSDPSRVDSAGDSYALPGWPTKQGHGQPAALFARPPVEEVFGASGSSAFYL
jgi:O-antigen biosynthesis protein